MGQTGGMRDEAQAAWNETPAGDLGARPGSWPALSFEGELSLNFRRMAWGCSWNTPPAPLFLRFALAFALSRLPWLWGGSCSPSAERARSWYEWGQGRIARSLRNPGGLGPGVERGWEAGRLARRWLGALWNAPSPEALEEFFSSQRGFSPGGPGPRRARCLLDRETLGVLTGALWRLSRARESEDVLNRAACLIHALARRRICLRALPQAPINLTGPFALQRPEPTPRAALAESFAGAGLGDFPRRRSRAPPIGRFPPGPPRHKNPASKARDWRREKRRMKDPQRRGEAGTT